MQKNNKSQLNELNVPKLRFKGFNNEWILKKFKNILIIFDGPHKTPQYFSAGFPFYSVEYVTQNKFNYIDEKQFKQFNKSYSPLVNDILFTRIGVIGITKIIKEQDNLCFSIYVSISAIRILDQAKFSSWFLNYSIQTNKFKKHLLSNSLTTAVPMKINIVDMYKLELNFPSPKEQRKIAEFFSLLDKQIELWERKLQLNELIKCYYLKQLFTCRQNHNNFSKLRFKNFAYEILELEVFISNGGIAATSKTRHGIYQFFDSSSEVKYIDEFMHDGEYIITPSECYLYFHYVNGKFSHHCKTYRISSNSDIKFIYYLLQSKRRELEKNGAGSSVIRFGKEIYNNLLSLKSIETQQKISQFFTLLDSINEMIKKQIKFMQKKKIFFLNNIYI